MSEGRLPCANCNQSDSRTWPAQLVRGPCLRAHLRGSCRVVLASVTGVLRWGGARAWAQLAVSDAEHCPGAAQGRLRKTIFRWQVAPGAGQ